jgi:signal transduction histidine kinase
MKTSNDDQIIGWSSEIKKVGGSFMSMVNNTLDYSYLESGKLEIIAKEYAFKDLASDIKDEVSALIEEKEIEYEVDISDEMPEKLYGDSARIKQVVVNIVSSITQELNKGNIVLRIYTGSRDENKVHMLFSVKEKGYGKTLSDEKMEMHVAKGIVSLMNSEIKTASVGEGCDYYFEIEQGLR